MSVINCRWICILFFTLSLTTAAESVPDSDEPDAPEEVMPNMPETSVTSQPSPKWCAPDYGNQTQALGWSAEAFSVPVGMEDRVQFWKDIYTKYTSDQGLLHDSKYINLVYESLDFSDITVQVELTPRQKEKARRKRVDEHKKEIVARLKRLQGLSSGDGLVGEGRRFWEMCSRLMSLRNLSRPGVGDDCVFSWASATKPWRESLKAAVICGRWKRFLSKRGFLSS